MSHLRNFVVLSVTLLFIYNIDAGPSDKRILPTEVEVREDKDVKVHLLQVLSDKATCYVRNPFHINCNLKLADGEKNATCNERLHYWPVNSGCGFYIMNVQKQDNEQCIMEWRLMSQSDNNKVVDIVTITVLETPMATIKKFVSYNDNRIIVQCTTGGPHATALSYCIFQSPTGFIIKVDESVTESNPIEHDNVRYWYNGRSLMAGDCGLVVEPASAIHDGEWMCTADIEFVDGDNESLDRTHDDFYDKFSGSKNTTGIISIVFGSLGCIIGLGMLITFCIKYRNRIWNRSQNQNNDSMKRQDDFSLNTKPTDVSILSRPSTNRSDSSNNGKNSGGGTGNINPGNKSNNGAQQKYI